MLDKNMAEAIDRHIERPDELERLATPERCAKTGCDAEAERRFGDLMFCDDHYYEEREAFEQLASSVAQDDLGLTEDEAEREADEFADIIS